ncbi:MAG: hypothetical protein IJ449_08965 [Clostridia bacterium]|nr:hypothetical protein [Clostridia bacterium]
MKIKSISVVLAGTILLAALFLSACSGEPEKDYSADSAYAAIFTEEDGAQEKELKNVLLAHLDAYNNRDAQAYYALFDMEKEDFNFNVAQLQNIWNAYHITYTPESIETAFINEDNAQALITMTCRGEDAATGEVLYYYRTELTYTLVRDGDWYVSQQQNSGEYDLMDTLESGAVTETAAE